MDRVMGSQTRLHAAKAVPSWPSINRALSAPHFCRIRKALAGSLAEEGASLLQKAKLLPPTEKTLAQCSLGIIDTSDQNTVTSSQVPCNYHPALAAYRLVLPPDTRTKQKQ